MKQLIFKVVAIFTGLAMCATFASCGDDNENEPEMPASKVAKISVNYSLSLSADYYDLWDIEVSYTGAGGNLITETTDIDWNMELELFTKDEIPTHYDFKVVARPKNPAPELIADKLYTLDSEYLLRVTTYDAAGKELGVYGMTVPQAKKQPTNGAHLEKAVTEIRTICDTNCDVTLN